MKKKIKKPKERCNILIYNINSLRKLSLRIKQTNLITISLPVSISTLKLEYLLSGEIEWKSIKLNHEIFS